MCLCQLHICSTLPLTIVLSWLGVLNVLVVSLSLVGEYPPQVHIKPALDVQKIENVRTCLDFLQYYDVPVQDIAAVGKRAKKKKKTRDDV